MPEQQEAFEFDSRPTIKGFPELRWTGKRPYRSTVYYPAQKQEQYGQAVRGGYSMAGSISSFGVTTYK